ncbi:hypothetical protein HN789_04900 [archaeon]|jgi:hypothetical protein|nr:hypothetical protein [archaeon]MBT4022391.1 hypothetical protein [archaeon]MBT4273269.1 hypothetical protein [archaeon]MBT4461288.1 hypothetical protein [archaeon]MBT4858585.1 hypothetical protein [archaeon]
MRFNKQLLSWVILAIIVALAFSFSDTGVNASDNTTNLTVINSSLEIWDTNFVYVNESVTIYANYSYENGTIIGIDICQFIGEYMSFNMTSGLYYYIETYDTPGNYSYDIYCYKEGYAEKEEFGIIEVIQNTTQNETNITIIDEDNDGYSSETDCDDNNANINPGMNEVFYNGIDDDCNPLTNDYVFFNVTTSRSSYAHQETVSIHINALNHSDTYITINTPTNVSYVYIFANGSYPATQEFSLTGISGIYSIDAINYYEDYTNTKSVNFTVSNSMAVNIVTNKNTIELGESINFRAEISGNIGEANLIWNMDDGNEEYDTVFDYTYDNPGTYNIVLIVTDQGGNQVIKTKQIVVNPKYFLEVKVVDNSTGNIILNSTVELDNDEKEVNLSGKVEYEVTNITYNLEVFAEGYYSYDENIKINKSLDFIVKLVKNPSDIIPSVSLISPGNNSDVSNPDFRFKFTDNGKAKCTLYVTEGDGWWLDVNESDNLNPNTEYMFKPELGKGNYHWKVQCRDEDDNVGSSKQYYLKIKESTTSTQNINSESETTYNVIQNVYNVIPDFDTYSPDEKKIAEYLKMDVLIKDAQRKLEMANRDLFNLRNEPDTQSIIDKRDVIYNDIDKIKDDTPLSVSVIDKADFVKYPTDEELEKLFEDYIALKGIELSKSQRTSLLEKNKLLQKKVSVRTLAYLVEIQYISGRSEEITLVSRILSTDETATDIMFVEFVPKDLIESVNEIVFITPVDNILQEDPVFEIQLNKGKEFLYYVKETIELDKIPKIDIAAISTIITQQDSKLTGFVVFDNLGFSESNTKIFIIQMIVVFILLGVYLFFYFTSGSQFTLPSFSFNFLKKSSPVSPVANYGSTKIKEVVYKPAVQESVVSNIPLDEAHKIEYMIQVIGKAHALLNVDLEKAALYYHEVKFLYEFLPKGDQDHVHNKVINLADELNLKHVQKLVDKAVIELAHNNKDNAHEIYDHIVEEFEKLSESHKQKVYKKCCEIALHLK